jgi:hypothetical protein
LLVVIRSAVRARTYIHSHTRVDGWVGWVPMDEWSKEKTRTTWAEWFI